MLSWNEYEFIEFFGVLPEHEEKYGFSETFHVEKDGLHLYFSIFPFEEETDVTLRQDQIETAIFSITIKNIIGFRFLKYPKGPEALEIVYASKQRSHSNNGWTENAVLHIEVCPHICITHFVE